MRAEHSFLEAGPVVETSKTLTWWIFAGGAANLLLARMLESELGGRCISRNLNVELKDGAGDSLVALREVLVAFNDARQPNQEDGMRHAEGAAQGRLSKFQVCLPDALLSDMLAGAVLDVTGARSAVEGAVEAGI